MKIEIQNIKDDGINFECDCCGCGLDAYGYRIFIDGEMKIERIPYSHCCSPISYNEDSLICDILTLVGIENINISYRDAEGFDEYE